MEVKAKLIKIGGSFGIVIPKIYLDYIGIKEGEEFKFSDREDKGDKELVLKWC